MKEKPRPENWELFPGQSLTSGFTNGGQRRARLSPAQAQSGPHPATGRGRRGLSPTGSPSSQRGWTLNWSQEQLSPVGDATEERWWVGCAPVTAPGDTMSRSGNPESNPLSPTTQHRRRTGTPSPKPQTRTPAWKHRYERASEAVIYTRGKVSNDHLCSRDELWDVLY